MEEGWQVGVQIALHCWYPSSSIRSSRKLSWLCVIVDRCVAKKGTSFRRVNKQKMCANRPSSTLYTSVLHLTFRHKICAHLVTLFLLRVAPQRDSNSFRVEEWDCSYWNHRKLCLLSECQASCQSSTCCLDNESKHPMNIRQVSFSSKVTQFLDLEGIKLSLFFLLVWCCFSKWSGRGRFFLKFLDIRRTCVSNFSFLFCFWTMTMPPVVLFFSTRCCVFSFFLGSRRR